MQELRNMTTAQLEQELYEYGDFYHGNEPSVLKSLEQGRYLIRAELAERKKHQETLEAIKNKSGETWLGWIGGLVLAIMVLRFFGFH